MDPLVGRTLGPYVLHSKLGSGGMGTVYRATHQLLDQPRAVKVLPPNLASDANFVQRFLREAQTAAKLRHPNIILIFDVGQYDGHYCIAMELVPGLPLSDVLRQPLSTERMLAILGQLAAALDYAHKQGMTHRDVKPANVLVSLDGHVTLIDFGIARAAEGASLTRTGLVIGTPHYLAPEAIKGSARGPSVDLYALGIMAYEILTGRLPFVGPDTHAILYDQVNTNPPRPRSLRADLPSKIERALLRQLAKDPAKRYPTAQEFVDALAAARQSRPPVPIPPNQEAGSTVKAVVASDAKRPRADSRRSGVVTLMVLIGLVILGAAIGSLMFQSFASVLVPTAPATAPAKPAAPVVTLAPSPSQSIADVFTTRTPAPQPNQTVTAPPSSGQRLQVANTDSEGANLRREASQTAEKIKTIPDGTVVEVVGPDRDADGRFWRNVRDPEGNVGWVLAGFLVAEGSLPSPVAGATTSPGTSIPRATSAVGEGRAQVGNTAGNGATIRSEPGGAVLKIIPEGTLIVVLAEERAVGGTRWRRVRDSSGTTGWMVSAALLPPGSVPPPTATQPASGDASAVPPTPAPKPGGVFPPNVEGMDEGEATKTLEQQGFKVTVRRQSAPNREGQVIDQNPGPRDTVPPGTEVSLTVGT